MIIQAVFESRLNPTTDSNPQATLPKFCSPPTSPLAPQHVYQFLRHDRQAHVPLVLGSGTKRVVEFRQVIPLLLSCSSPSSHPLNSTLLTPTPSPTHPNSSPSPRPLPRSTLY